MTRLEEIEQERSTLLRKLDSLDFEKHNLQMAQWGITVGMLVKDRDGKVYQVEDVEYFWYDRQPWLKGKLQRKDGSFGVSRRVYSPWKKI